MKTVNLVKEKFRKIARLAIFLLSLIIKPEHNVVKQERGVTSVYCSIFYSSNLAHLLA